MRVIAGAAMILAAAVLVATASGATTAKGGAAQSITLPLTLDFTTMDIQSEEASQNTFASGFYDRLVAIDPQGKIVPYIATPTKVSPTSVTFKVHSGVKCTSGGVINASAVYQSLKRLIAIPKARVNFMSSYFGNGPYSVSMNAKAKTVTFRTGTPYRYLLQGFAAPASVILCPAAFSALKSDPSALHDKEYGSGPYTLVSLTHGVKVVLARRPGWNWGPVINGHKMTSADIPPTLTLLPVANPDAAINLALTGGLDNASATTPSQVQRMDADKSFMKIVQKDWNPTNTLLMNQRPGSPLSSEPLRHAISMILNPTDYNQARYGGLGTPLTSGMILKGQPCYQNNSNLLPQGSVAQAKTLLTGAGYSYKGSALYDPNGKAVHVMFLGDGPTDLGGDYVFNQLKALGLDVDFQNLAGSGYTLNFLSGHFDMTVSANPAPIKNSPIYKWQYFWGNPNEAGGANVSDAGAGDATLARDFKLGLSAGSQAASCKYIDAAVSDGLKHYYWKPLTGSVTYNYYRASKVSKAWLMFKVGDALPLIAKH